MNKEERVIELINQLENTFEIRTFLDHDPYKVLVRTILSQRTRDENTDQATDNLFAKYKICNTLMFHRFFGSHCLSFCKQRCEFFNYLDRIFHIIN